MFGVNGLIQRRAILNPTIRVVDQFLLAPALFQRLLESDCHRFGMQALMHMMPNDLARPGVRHQAQIERPVTRWKVGDICHPDLFRPLGNDLFRAGLQ